MSGAGETCGRTTGSAARTSSMVTTRTDMATSRMMLTQYGAVGRGERRTDGRSLVTRPNRSSGALRIRGMIATREEDGGMVEPMPRSRNRDVLAILLLLGPFWRRSWAWRLARLGVFGFYLYAGALLVLMALEDRLLFPGATFARPPSEPSERLGIREVTLTSADGERIHAWFTAPKQWTPQ